MLSVVTNDGTTETGSLMDDIVREGARRMLAAALEAEVNQYTAELTDQREEKGRRLVEGRYVPGQEVDHPTTLPYRSKIKGVCRRCWSSA